MAREVSGVVSKEASGEVKVAGEVNKEAKVAGEVNSKEIPRTLSSEQLNNWVSRVSKVAMDGDICAINII